MTAEALEALDHWRRKQDDMPGRVPGRPEAIRRLVDHALDSLPKKKA